MKKTLIAAVGIALAFSATVASAATIYTRDLTIGSTGADVVSLQTTLESKGFLVIPATVSKGYFGALTKSALGKYQAANGIMPAVGYFGPITRAHFNAMTDGGSNDNGGDNNDNSGDLQGGEGDIKDFDILGNPGNADINEGETDQVLGFKFEAKDSDLRLERLEVEASSTTDDPWDFFDSATLFRGSEEIASVDNLDDEDSWDEDVNNTSYTFRFDNVDDVVEEGDVAKYYIEVTAQDNLDSGDVPADFEFAISDDGLRAVDAEGIDIYEGNQSDDRTVTFDGPDAGDVDLSLDEDNNEDRTVFVDENSDTNGVEIMRFTVESNTSDNQIQELAVALASTTNENGGATLSEVIKSLTLEVDGDEVGSEDLSSGAGTSTATFEDLEIDVAEDEQIEVVVLADIDNQQDNYLDGFEFHASVATTSIVMEDSNGDDVDFGTQGNLFGGDIELRVNGMSAEFVDATETRTNGSVSGDADSVEFKLVFEVSASGDDVYLDGDTFIASTATSGTDGIAWSTSTDSTTGTSSVTAILTASDGYKSSDTNTAGDKRFKITDGNTRKFTLTMSIPAGADNTSAGVVINGLKWDTTSQDVMSNAYTINLDDFRSDVVTGLYIR